MTQLFQHSRAAACAMRQKDGSTICAPETIPNRVLRKVFSSHGRKGKDETSRHSHAPASLTARLNARVADRGRSLPVLEGVTRSPQMPVIASEFGVCSGRAGHTVS